MDVKDVVGFVNVLGDKFDSVVDFYDTFFALVDGFLLGFLECEILFLVVDDEALDYWRFFVVLVKVFVNFFRLLFEVFVLDDEVFEYLIDCLDFVDDLNVSSIELSSLSDSSFD